MLSTARNIRPCRPKAESTFAVISLLGVADVEASRNARARTISSSSGRKMHIAANAVAVERLMPAQQ